jgi:hypothetical protein
MSELDDQYNSHPVWSHLDRVDALLDETEDRLSEAGTEAVESHARIRSVSRYARSLLDRSNSSRNASTNISDSAWVSP